MSDKKLSEELEEFLEEYNCFASYYVDAARALEAQLEEAQRRLETLASAYPDKWFASDERAALTVRLAQLEAERQGLYPKEALDTLRTALCRLEEDLETQRDAAIAQGDNYKAKLEAAVRSRESLNGAYVKLQQERDSLAREVARFQAHPAYKEGWNDALLAVRSKIDDTHYPLGWDTCAGLFKDDDDKTGDGGSKPRDGGSIAATQVKVGQVWQDSRNGVMVTVAEIKGEGAYAADAGGFYLIVLADDGTPCSHTWTLVHGGSDT